MYKKIRTLHLNGKLLDSRGLISFCVQKNNCQGTLSWEREITDFILEWLSDNKEITVKTSGSTGLPKEIKLLKNNMLNSARMSIDYLHLNKGTKALLCMPVRFIAGRMMVIRAMLGGWELFYSKPALNPFKEIDSDFRFNFTAITPMQLASVFTDEKSKTLLDNTDKIIVGGAPLTFALVEKCKDLRTCVFETYGMTETISHIALKKINGNDKSDYFELLQGITISADERNCLVINAPGLSESEIITNDIVEIKDPFHFRFIGRHDHIINSGGMKISPELTESKINKLTDRNFYISFIPDELLGEKVVLVMEGASPGAEKELEFLNKCRLVLDKYEMPKQILYKRIFLKTENGKLIREAGDKLQT